MVHGADYALDYVDRGSALGVLFGSSCKIMDLTKIEDSGAN